jgi:hypothetical protein
MEKLKNSLTFLHAPGIKDAKIHRIFQTENLTKFEGV